MRNNPRFQKKRKEQYCGQGDCKVLMVSRVIAVMFKEIKEFREISGNACPSFIFEFSSTICSQNSA
ncbi:MAG: hypothetical protein E7135_00140 [Rikenellaceae bacterium]|nr:hypothetical protein [Rikenellaceae bacterium]